MPTAPSAVPVADAPQPADGGQPEDDGARPASTGARHGLLGRLGPLKRRAASRVLVAALLVATICWYFGADVSHAILIGTALTLGLIGFDNAEGPALDTTDWRGSGGLTWVGARRDVADLSSSLRGSFGRVSDSAVSRVRQLARQRLAQHQLDLFDPADRREVEELLGSRTFAVLVRDERRPPVLRSVLHCLDALDALGPTRPAAPPSSAPHHRSLVARRRARIARAR